MLAQSFRNCAGVAPDSKKLMLHIVMWVTMHSHFEDFADA